MEKLTLQDCFKYPNAKVKLTTAAEITGTYYNTKIFENIEHYFNYYDKPVRDEFISDCKLILRPLKNSLVQAEKDYLLKTFLKPNDYDFDCLFFDEIEESIAFLLDILPFNMVAKLIDYLRSINIDIDNLQEKGVAIYE